MKKYFNLNNKSKILIYGAAAIGLIVHDICKEVELTVLGFMDKRGDEISQLQGLKVWNLRSDFREIDKDVVVFIAVKNVFEHDNIVRKLLEMGFHNIIYRPYSVIKGGGTEEEKFINEIYDKFMNHELGNTININVPQTFEVGRYIFKNYSLIKDNDTHKIVYVPLECIYTDNKKIPNVFNWSDLPIMALVPHIGFFKWLDGQEGFSYQYYMDFCISSAQNGGQINITQAWKENVIRNRSDVFNNMNLSIERDYDFFVRNAPVGEWNTGGYFNLRSGKHRAAFFMAKGKMYFPLKISREDFDCWINQPKLDKFIKKFDEFNLQEIHAPIEHPYFFDLRCDNRTFWWHILCSFVYLLAKYQYELCGCVELKMVGGVIVSINDDGYIGRNLKRYGLTVEIYNETVLSKILDELILKGGFEEKKEITCAIIEYGFGQEINFEDIVSKELKVLVVIVKEKDMNYFNVMAIARFNKVKIVSGYKDGEIVRVYWLEK